MIITVDGQSSSGKSSLACALAHELGYHFLGSGSIYRLVAYAKSEGLNVDQFIEKLKTDLKYKFFDGEMHVLVANEDVTIKLHDAKVTKLASEMAKNADLRQKLLSLQKSFDRSPGLVAEGRDMGTVVFPDATVKLFLVSDIKVRAKRRLQQLEEMGISRSLEEEIMDLKQRDERDENRAISPLIPHKDAIIVDTSEGSKDENIGKLLTYVKKYI